MLRSVHSLRPLRSISSVRSVVNKGGASPQMASRVLSIVQRGFSTGRKKTKVVIIGTGWAGYRVLRDLNADSFEINVISPRNHFLFTPLLASTTVGTLEFRGVVEPVRMVKKPFNYVQASVTGIDPDKQIVHVESFYEQRETDDAIPVKPKFTMSYDQLVIAAGSVPNTFGIPGVEKYCYFLKQLSDARDIRQRILECFERAQNPTISEEERQRLLHFVVVGGGPTSVEFAAELHDFLQQDVRKTSPDLAKRVKVTLLEAGPKLLSAFDSNLSEYTLKLFRNRKVDVRTQTAVKEVKRHHIVLQDGTEIPFGMGVWSTGVSPVPMIKELPFLKDRSGRLIVDEFLRVRTPPLRNVFAIGDCAALETDPLPPTAQAAEQQGRYVSKQLNRVAKGQGIQPFRYQNRGSMAYVGGMQALVDTPLVKNGGFFSWIFWNAAYLTKLVSVKNKIMIPMYWFKTFLFGRDITRF